jgi:hypothetical protein
VFGGLHGCLHSGLHSLHGWQQRTGAPDPMRITIDTSELRTITQRLQFSERRTRAVTATVLTRVARQIETDWRGQFEQRLDRATPLTKRGTVVQQATAATLQAVVKLRDSSTAGSAVPSEYLAPQEFGGPRDLKKFERALQAQGSMPRGYRVVPAGGAKLDAYGNISRGQIVQVIAQLGRDFSPGYARVIGKTAAKRLAAAKRTGREYVAILNNDRSRLEPGVYQRKGRGLVRVFAYVSNVSYRTRLRLVPDGLALARQQLPAQTRRAVGESLQRLLARGA